MSRQQCSLLEGSLPGSPRWKRVPWWAPLFRSLLHNRVEDDPNAANFSPEDVADVSIVQELEDSGFIADLYE